MLILQWLVLGLLAFVVGFGGSMIVNLVFRRWWLNLVIFVAAIVWAIAAHGGVATSMAVPLVALAIGTGLASIAHRALRNQGYRLFQEGFDRS